MPAFLTARWSNLILLTYPVPADLLAPRLPPGCALDLRNGDAFVSLVAFDFLATRVGGIPWPGYRNFPEINLRFYVRCGAERGVCFIREFVPSRLVASLARILYNEPYRAARMKSQTRESPDHITVQHHLTLHGKTNTVEILAGKPPVRPDSQSVEHFFKEHQWGFGRARNGRLLRYEVAHQEWDIYPVQSFKLDWDWPLVYGQEWSILQNAQPSSVILAAGSPVAVYPKMK